MCGLEGKMRRDEGRMWDRERSRPADEVQSYRAGRVGFRVMMKFVGEDPAAEEERGKGRSGREKKDDWRGS